MLPIILYISTADSHPLPMHNICSRCSVGLHVREYSVGCTRIRSVQPNVRDVTSFLQAEVLDFTANMRDSEPVLPPDAGRVTRLDVWPALPCWF
ncbi:hypothetical protein RRG08_038811 [Elysia crispata]|uniref:Uncharacterized protein n=1 Tax=Elysia crispata TaxID=231223 RepID=A0AAE1D3S1_9GAST|nr:hypothetical protein RRG08_038811 [Elysia crispata]